MLVITALPITNAEVEENDLSCDLIDYAAILALEAQTADHMGCNQIPAYSVAIKPAEDMVIPLFLCSIHFNALKISLHEGVAVDEDIFGKFPKN